MLSRLLLALLLLPHLCFALVNWNIDTTASRFVEDSVIIFIASDASLPSLALSHSSDCPSSLQSATGIGIPGTEWIPLKGQKEGQWIIPGKTLPAGPLCLAPISLASYKPLSDPIALYLPSKEKHVLNKNESAYPWNVSWTRPASVSWSHLQIVTRDQDGKSERILFETITQKNGLSLAQQNIAWIPPSATLWIKLANAYDSSETYTDKNSWRVFTLAAHSDSLPAAILQLPKDGARFTRTQMVKDLFFQWQTQTASLTHQLSIYQKKAGRWINTIQRTTNSSSMTIPSAMLPDGSFYWIVTSMDMQHRMGQSLPSSFDISGDFQSYQVQVTENGLPLNGVDVMIQPMNGTQIIKVRTGLIDGHSGMIQFNAQPGNARIEFSRPGFAKSELVIALPFNATDLISFEIPNFETGSLAGAIMSPNRIPKANITVQFTSTSGSIVSTTSDLNGLFKASLSFGAWHWKIAPFDSGTIFIQNSRTLQLDTIFIPDDLILLQGYSKAGTRIQLTQLETQRQFETTSDANGYYKIAIPKGTYRLLAYCPGYLSFSGRLEFLNSQSYNIHLKQGTIRIQGMVSALEELSLGSPEIRPLPATRVFATITSTDTIEVLTDLQGNYSLELPTAESWSICAKPPQKSPMCKDIFISENEELFSTNFLFVLQARIQGTLNGLLKNVSNPEILLVQNGSTIKKATASLGINNQWKYEFQDVPAGSYQIHARSFGYTQTSIPSILVSTQGRLESRGIYTSDPITMAQSGARLAIHSRFHVFGIKSSSAAFARTDPIDATILLKTPGDTLFPAPDTLSIGNGYYEYAAIPEDRGWIPLWNYSNNLSGTLQVDSILWPVHFVVPDTITPNSADSIRFSLEKYEVLSNAILHVLDGGQYKTIQPTINLTDSAIFTFKLAEPTTSLSYWFEVVSDKDQRTYSNPAPFLHYVTPIQWKSIPFTVFSNTPDSLYLQTGTSIQISLFAYTLTRDAELTQLLAQKGKITWSMSPSSGLDVSSSKTQPMNTTITARQKGNYKVTANLTFGKYKNSINFAVIVDSIHTGTLRIRAGLDPDGLIFGGDTVDLRSEILDTLKRPWNVPAKWQLYPQSAGHFIQNQLLVIDSNFIGPIQIKAEYQGQTNAIKIPVFHSVLPLNKGSILVHDSSLSVWIPDSLSNQHATVLGLERFESLSKSKIQKDGKDTSSSFYNLIFPGTNPVKMPLLGFSVDLNQTNTPTPFLLDSLTGKMEQIDSIENSNFADSSNTNWIKILPRHSLPVYYGLMQKPNEHQKTEIECIPNPFSPYVTSRIDGNSERGTAIHYTPYVPGIQQVYVSLEIVSLSGDPVRKLLGNQLQKVSEQIIYWDGTTDSGHLARNGRYLVLLYLRNSASGKIVRQIAKPVVVFR